MLVWFDFVFCKIANVPGIPRSEFVLVVLEEFVVQSQTTTGGNLPVFCPSSGPLYAENAQTVPQFSRNIVLSK